MSELTRQELCVQLRISESTVRRLEAQGMPFVQYEGVRSKRYNLVEVSRWVRGARPETVADLAGQSARNYYGANARAKAINRLPAWADKKAIKAIYENARRLTRETGLVHQVDHVVPLNGHYVSGLHVAANLRVIPGVENAKKHNYFEAGQ
jgi:hypothetical protein